MFKRNRLKISILSLFLILLASVLPVSAQQLVYPKFHATDANGSPLAGGLVYTYAPGTSTPKAAYTDVNLTIPATNPIVLDGSGDALIYLDGLYKIVLKASDGSTVWSVDNVIGITSTAVTPTVTAGSATPGVYSAVDLYGQTASNTTFTYSVGQVVVEDTNGTTGKIRNLTGTVNSASVGALGLDKGALPSSCWMHFFAAQKADASAKTIFMSPVAAGGGSGLTVNVTGVSGGAITSVNATPVSQGTGYKVGDVERVTTGDGTALVQCTATSTTMPVPGACTTLATTPVYGGASGYLTGGGQATTTYPTVPTDYVQIGYLGSAYVDGSAHFGSIQQVGRIASWYDAVAAVSSGTETSLTPISLAAAVPQTAKRVFGYALAQGTTNPHNYASISSDSAGHYDIQSYYNYNGQAATGKMVSQILTPQYLWYVVQTNGVLTVNVTSWEY